MSKAVRYEAKTYRVFTTLEDVPVIIQVRAFVEGGEVRAIRSTTIFRYQPPSGDPFRVPTIDIGKATARQLRRAEKKS